VADKPGKKRPASAAGALVVVVEELGDVLLHLDDARPQRGLGAGPRRRRALLLALVELVDGAGLDAGGDGDALPHVAVARDLTREQIRPLDMSQYSMFP
jgi:hypothetical protein